MAATDRTVIWWELAGAAFVVAAGSALHFAFAWSGHWRPLAVFAAVNESIWEHLKLAFWPGFLWAILEWPFLRHGRAGSVEFWGFKGFALLVPPVAITTIFLSYTAILGRNLLALDIGTFVVSVALAHAVSAWLLVRRPGAKGVRRIGALLLACQVAACATLTFFPPPLGLFEETRSGLYGIPAAVPGRP